MSSAVPAAAQVKLEFANGLVNLSAQNAPLRTILAEWSRLGGTRIINGERVTGTPVTIQLTGMPERQALDTLLRGIPGYMIAARQTPGGGASSIDRVLILPTTTAPRAATPAPASFASSAPPPPPPQAVDNDGPDDGGVVVVGGAPAVRSGATIRMNGNAQQQAPAPVPVNGARSGVVQGDDQPVPAPPSANNPFGVQPGTVRPGVIIPPPGPPQDKK